MAGTSIDTSTLMLVMAMQGGRGGMNGMLLPLILMGGLGGSSTGGQLGGAFGKMGITGENMMIGMMPGLGMAGKALIGGAGAVIAGSMFRKKSSGRRRKTRVVYSRRRR